MTNLDGYFVSTSLVRAFEVVTFQMLQHFEDAWQMNAYGYRDFWRTSSEISVFL
jgi:hypothetical protein